MKFRPCIDIHNGKVKQIVGSSLLDESNYAIDNFVSEQDGSFYGKLYKENGLTGGHIILLNPKDSSYYEEDLQQANLALEAFPGGLQIGGGVDVTNAERFIKMGASHVVVTSYVFSDGKVNMEHLNNLYNLVGKEHLVLDLSCRKKADGKYYVVTNRWQKFSDVVVDDEILDMFSEYCDEFLIHAVDVEGKANGIEKELVTMLGKWKKIPITYAGGIKSLKDLEYIKEYGAGSLDFTIGSALDLFGGTLSFDRIVKEYKSI